MEKNKTSLQKLELHIYWRQKMMRILLPGLYICQMHQKLRMMVQRKITKGNEGNCVGYQHPLKTYKKIIKLKIKIKKLKNIFELQNSSQT